MRLTQLALAGLGAIVAVVALIVGFGWAQTLLSTDASAQDHAPTTVAAYLAAWESGDFATMRTLIRGEPDVFEDPHRDLIDGLGVTRLQLDTGSPVEEQDGLRDYPVEVTAHLDGVDEPVRWTTSLRVIRERGEWSVAWQLSTIHPELRPTWHFGRRLETVQRAAILAADGQQVAGDGTSVSIGFEPSAVTDRDRLVEAFEAALPGSGRTAAREVNRSNLRDGWFYPVVTVSLQRADEAWPQLRPIPGVLRRQIADRSVFGPQFAQHTIGVVSPATAEQLEALGDDAEPGMLLAQYGLEKAFDERLEGTDIVRVGLRADNDGDDEPFRHQIATIQEVAAEPVHTTLDIRIQTAVEAALAGVEQPAAIVVVDGVDGAIRAAASRPLSGYHRAFEGRYPPGSTFKIVTTEALLAAGHTSDETVACPPETVVGGLAVRNAGGLSLSEATLADAFVSSCNTTFATLAARAGASTLSESVQRFGFGVPAQLPLAAFSGSFPTPADTAELAAASFGQARVEVSVLHMASVAAATVTGTWHQPYLLDGAGPIVASPIHPGALPPLQEMMRQVVTRGTGEAAAVSGVEVAGKTGTAQAAGGVEHAWFVGVHDGLGFAVLVEGGGSGGSVAAPIAARFVQQLAR